VVITVRVAVAADAPVICTVEFEPKLNVGGACAPVGPEVTAAVNATLPTKPWAGVMVIVEVFPLVAPAATATAVPTRERNGLLELTT
jgi:hypothetical protein